MRLLFLILFYFVTSLTYGQDSLQTDTSAILILSGPADTLVADSGATSVKTPVAKKKTKKKTKKKKITISKAVEIPVVIKEKKQETVRDSYVNLLILVVLLIMGVIAAYLLFSKPTSKKSYNADTPDPDDDFLSDSMNRLLMSRRDYYNNIYLKSQAWKRKRYVVFKRDKWRCVYCGGRATQVHHTRYAKYNIGKEPIDWLVSICKPCHNSKHQ